MLEKAKRKPCIKIFGILHSLEMAKHSLTVTAQWLSQEVKEVKVQFLLTAHAHVAGSIPSVGLARDSRSLMFLFTSLFLSEIIYF